MKIGRLYLRADGALPLDLDLVDIEARNGRLEFTGEHTVWPGQADITLPDGTYEVTLYGSDGTECATWRATVEATHGHANGGPFTITVILPIRLET